MRIDGGILWVGGVVYDESLVKYGIVGVKEACAERREIAVD